MMLYFGTISIALEHQNATNVIIRNSSLTKMRFDVCQNVQRMSGNSCLIAVRLRRKCVPSARRFIPIANNAITRRANYQRSATGCNSKIIRQKLSNVATRFLAAQNARQMVTRVTNVKLIVLSQTTNVINRAIKRKCSMSICKSAGIVRRSRDSLLMMSRSAKSLTAEVLMNTLLKMENVLNVVIMNML